MNGKAFSTLMNLTTLNTAFDLPEEAVRNTRDFVPCCQALGYFHRPATELFRTCIALGPGELCGSASAVDYADIDFGA